MSSDVSYDKSKIKYNPYIIIPIDVIIDLKPSKLNNNLYNNLVSKSKKFNGICYKDYGYIQEVQRIIHFDQGILVNEFNDSSIRYQVTLQCKVCYPYKNDIYYARVNVITPGYIQLIAGPMQIIVKPENNNIKNPEKLTIGTYSVIRVLNAQICHMESYIIVKGELLNIVDNDDEIKEMFEKQYEN